MQQNAFSLATAASWVRAAEAFLQCVPQTPPLRYLVTTCRVFMSPASRRFASLLARLSAVCTLLACDQDPFHLRNHQLSGIFVLQRFETDLYFVVDSESDEEIGGEDLGGAVLRIGTQDSMIVAQLRQHFGGDTVYALVNASTRKVSMPLTETALAALLGGRVIPLERADSAWKRR
jgi:hypothetical protein